MLSCSTPRDGSSSNAGTPGRRWRPSPRRPASRRASSTRSSRASPTCSSPCSSGASPSAPRENARVSAGLAGRVGRVACAAAHANARHAEEGGDWSRLLIEFRVLAARDAGLNARYAALHTQTLDQFTDAVRAVLARAGLAPAYPPREFCRADLRPRRRPGARAGRRHRGAPARALGRPGRPASCRPVRRSPVHDHPAPRRARCPPRPPPSIRSAPPRRAADRAAGQLSREHVAADRLEPRRRSPPTSGAQLRALLAHADRALAVPRAPAARDRSGRGRPRQISPLPVMTKSEMMNELDDVFTDRRLTHAGVERALAEAGPEPATAARLLPRAHLRRQLRAARGVRARPPGRGAVLRLADPRPGRAARGDGRAAAGRAADRDGRRRLTRARHRYRRAAVAGRPAAVPVPPACRSPYPLSEIVEQLNALQAPALYGYPSMLARLAAENGRRPPADLAGRGDVHQRNLHTRAARGDLRRFRRAVDRLLRLH